MVKVVVNSQLLASVKITSYVPAAKPEIVSAVFKLVDTIPKDVQSKVYGGVPPVADRMTVPELSPEQATLVISSEPTKAPGPAGTITDSVSVQPVTKSVTSTSTCPG